jgi:Domain of unknown function (DUF4189)
MPKIVVLVVLVLVTAFPARAAGPYGAIAYSREADNAAAVADAPSRAQGVAAALKSCRDETAQSPDSCQPAMWFKDACGALAGASDGSWGTGWGQTQQIATNWAFSVCKTQGGQDCKLKVVICSPGGAGYIPDN